MNNNTNNSFEVQGKYLGASEIRIVGQNKSAVREFFIEIEDKYPQLVKFQVWSDLCDTLDSINKGQIVNVYFNLRGKKVDNNVYNNLTAWKVGVTTAAPNVTNTIAAPMTASSVQTETTVNTGEDSLPF